MSRLSSFLLGSLMVGQILLPVSVQASDGSHDADDRKVRSAFTFSHFFPVLTPTPRPTRSVVPTVLLPIITTFRPTTAPVAPSAVSSPVSAPVPTAVPTVIVPVILPLVTTTSSPSSVPSTSAAPTLSPSVAPLPLPAGAVMLTPHQEDKKEVVLPQEKKDAVKQFYNSMQDRLNEVIDKLTNLSDRMSVKVTELKNKDIDTSSIEKALTAAQTQIGLAKTGLADADKKANALLNSQDRKAAFDTFKSTILSVQGNLKSAHELLTNAANELKLAYQKISAANPS